MDIEETNGLDLELVKMVKDLLVERNLQITAAESLTGGAFLSALSSLTGASKILSGGLVTYSNEAKQKNLGVTKETIERYGVVSAECAIEMAEKVKEKFSADIGVSLTGVAGPDSLEGEMAGTVWIGISKNGMESFAKKFHFNFDRNKNRELSAMVAFDMVRKVLLNEMIENTTTIA